MRNNNPNFIRLFPYAPFRLHSHVDSLLLHNYDVCALGFRFYRCCKSQLSQVSDSAWVGYSVFLLSIDVHLIVAGSYVSPGCIQKDLELEKEYGAS